MVSSVIVKFLLKRLAVATVLLCLGCGGLGADPLHVAVATNFKPAAERITALYREQFGSDVGGSSGALYAQIVQGAPYDLFLSADETRPRQLEKEGFACPKSRFAYAVGQLLLWSYNAEFDPDATLESVLTTGSFRSLAIANPELAPYGLAAEQVLQSLDLWERLQDRVVIGQNIGQTYALVASGNADLGFVALSQLQKPGRNASGRAWAVPPSLHKPILQDAVLLKRACEKPEAKAFLAFLRGPDAEAEIRAFGYGRD